MSSSTDVVTSDMDDISSEVFISTGIDDIVESEQRYA